MPTSAATALAALDIALSRLARALSPLQLDALADGVQRGHGLVAPGGSGPRDQALVAAVATALEQARGTGPQGAVPEAAGLTLALRNAAELRRDHARSSVSAVWTGPNAPGAQRLTAGVVQQLLAQADEQILVVSFAVSVVTGIKEALGSAAARGVQIDCVFETQDDSRGRLSFSAASNLADIPGIQFWRWPAESRGHENASLHAKAIVVDQRDALITSANLTERAFNDNLELGVLLKHHAVARSIDEHIRGLMAAGVLVAETT